MASKQVIVREKFARAVTAAADTHASQVAAQLQEMLAPYLAPDEVMPDIKTLTLLVRRAIGAQLGTLVQADRSHEAELGDDVAPRDVRDRAAGDVRATLLGLRAAADNGYGRHALIALGLGDQTPYEPAVLAAQGRTVLDKLGDPAVALGTPLRPALAVDRAAYAADLGASVPVLEQALADVAREAREAESTLVAKQKAMDEYDRVFTRGASWLSATFALAGQDSLAARVRPPVRRASRNGSVESPDIEPGTGEPSVEPGAGEPGIEPGAEPAAIAPAATEPVSALE